MQGEMIVMTEIQKLVIPSNYNYVGAFLTFDCNLGCPYCINKHDKLAKVRPLSADKWISAINRIETRKDLPVTLQGGEPTCHPDFYYIVNSIIPDIPLDLLTNGEFDPIIFAKCISTDRFRRDAPYASIRVSYHPGVHKNPLDLLERVNWLRTIGYQIGMWSVRHPKYIKQVESVQKMAECIGIDFRLKEFLGWYDGKLYGTYRYPEAVAGRKVDTINTVFCKGSELLIAPTGNVFRCHKHLYNNTNSIGNILLDDNLLNMGIACNDYGDCNPCDIKLKTNRFQEGGHCAVDISSCY